MVCCLIPPNKAWPGRHPSAHYHLSNPSALLAHQAEPHIHDPKERRKKTPPPKGETKQHPQPSGVTKVNPCKDSVRRPPTRALEGAKTRCSGSPRWRGGWYTRHYRRLLPARREGGNQNPQMGRMTEINLRVMMTLQTCPERGGGKS